MIKIGDYLIEHNLYNKVNISLFANDLFIPMLETDNNNYCGGIADTSIAIDYKGDIFTCIRYMESSLNGKQKPLIIGNIYKGYLTTKEYQENYEKLTNITRRS